MREPEKRRAPRYDVDVSAEVNLGRRVIPMRTKNLSETGVCLVGRTPLAEGGDISLSLFLVVDGIEDPDSPPLEVGANVIWASPGNDDDHLAGCHFSDLDGGKVELLQRFLGRLE
jgi:hypothetical protein